MNKDPTRAHLRSNIVSISQLIINASLINENSRVKNLFAIYCTDYIHKEMSAYANNGDHRLPAKNFLNAPNKQVKTQAYQV
jgi:hypothetical protein